VFLEVARYQSPQRVHLQHSTREPYQWPGSSLKTCMSYTSAVGCLSELLPDLSVFGCYLSRKKYKRQS
jgi:hypothetical protein